MSEIGLCCKDIGVRKLEFEAAVTQFLYDSYIYFFCVIVINSDLQLYCLSNPSSE